MKISTDFALLSMNWSETKLKHLVCRLVLLFSEFFLCGGSERGPWRLWIFRLKRIGVSGGGLRDVFLGEFLSSSFPCFLVIVIKPHHLIKTS